MVKKNFKNKVRSGFLGTFIIAGVPFFGIDLYFWISVMPSQDITISNLFSKYINLIVGICLFYISIIIKNKLVAINPIFDKITKIIFILFICFVLSGLFLCVNSPTNTNSSEQSFYMSFWIFLVSPIIFYSVILYDEEIRELK